MEEGSKKGVLRGVGFIGSPFDSPLVRPPPLGVGLRRAGFSGLPPWLLLGRNGIPPSKQWWSDEPDDRRERGCMLRVGSGCFTLQSICPAGLPWLTRSLDHQDLG